jgi:hypothetical protein
VSHRQPVTNFRAGFKEDCLARRRAVEDRTARATGPIGYRKMRGWIRKVADVLGAALDDTTAEQLQAGIEVRRHHIESLEHREKQVFQRVDGGCVHVGALETRYRGSYLLDRHPARPSCIGH